MARRESPEQLTPVELEIMKVLWDGGPASVQEVQERLKGVRPMAYTSVQTMLNILVRKKKAKRVLADRAYRYRAAVTREKALGTSLKDIISRMFGGSAEALVMNLVETKQLDAGTLRRLNEMIAAGEGDDD